MQNTHGMELLGRIAAALGISLVLTLLLMALYQDDRPERIDQSAPDTIAEYR